MKPPFFCQTYKLFTINKLFIYLIHFLVTFEEFKKNEYFFKYFPINCYSKENLRDNQLFLRNPRQFNDPFDSKSLVIMRGTKEKWDAYLKYNNMNYTVEDLKMKGHLIEEGNEYFLSPASEL